jgi:hypothetical protein
VLVVDVALEARDAGIGQAGADIEVERHHHVVGEHDALGFLQVPRPLLQVALVVGLV